VRKIKIYCITYNYHGKQEIKTQKDFHDFIAFFFVCAFSSSFSSLSSPLLLSLFPLFFPFSFFSLFFFFGLKKPVIGLSLQNLYHTSLTRVNAPIYEFYLIFCLISCVWLTEVRRW